MKILPIKTQITASKANYYFAKQVQSQKPKSDVFISFGNSLQKNAKVLTDYIKALPDFKIEKMFDGNYNHIGATLTETVLQAGLNYKGVVKPKVLQIMQHPEAKTVKGFLALTKDGTEKYKKIIHWNDDKKPDLVIKLAKFFDREGVNTEADLKKWLQDSKNPEKLRKIKGIGPKTIDYLKILVGIPNCAIDRHLFNFIEQAGIKLEQTGYDNQYKEAQNIIEKTAEDLKTDKSVLDYSIWSYMSQKIQKK